MAVSLILSSLDYGNAILSCQLKRLQSVMNSAARSIVADDNSALSVISANLFVPPSTDRAARSVDGGARTRSSISAARLTDSANQSIVRN